MSCRAGCQAADVLRSLGLGWADLFGEVDETMPRTNYQQQFNQGVDFVFRAKVYAHLLGHLGLTPEHSHDLVARGMTAEEVTAGGYKSLTGPYDTQVICDQVVKDIGGPDAAYHIPGLVEKAGHWTLNVTEGLVIPIMSLDGFVRALQVRTGGKTSKYVTVSGGPGGNTGTPVHVPAKAVVPLMDGATLLVTEGPIKAQLACGRGYSGSVGLLGADSSPRPLLSLVSRLRPPDIVLAFDMDRQSKTGVAQAAFRLAESLVREGQTVSLAEWDPDYNGIDDYLVSVPNGKIRLRPYRVKERPALRGGV